MASEYVIVIVRLELLRAHRAGLDFVDNCEGVIGGGFGAVWYGPSTYNSAIVSPLMTTPHRHGPSSRVSKRTSRVSNRSPAARD